MLPEPIKRFKVDQSEVELGDRLGYGTYGEVFKGYWRGTLIAIKRIHRHEFNQNGLRMFKEEAVMMIKLASPNVVQVSAPCLFAMARLSNPHPTPCRSSAFLSPCTTLMCG